MRKLSINWCECVNIHKLSPQRKFANKITFKARKIEKTEIQISQKNSKIKALQTPVNNSKTIF